MKIYKILVLNDGETWGGLDGASVCIISEADHDALCDGSKDVCDIQPIVEIGLSDNTEDEDSIQRQEQLKKLIEEEVMNDDEDSE